MKAVSRRSLAHLLADRLQAEPERRQELVRSLAAYLLDTRRTADADLLLNDVASELAQRFGHLSVEVVSAAALNDAVRDQLRQYLVDRTSARSVDMRLSVNPDLRGGLIASTADAELDLSVRAKLRQLTAIA